MLQIRCTLTMAKALGLSNDDLHEVGEASTVLGNWCATVFTSGNCKSIVFMSERTLLSFIIHGISDDNIKNFPLMFLRGLGQLLQMEKFSNETIMSILKEYTTITLTKTSNESLMNSLDDLADQYAQSINVDGGIEACDLQSIMLEVNRKPKKILGWSHSIDTVRELIEMVPA